MITRTLTKIALVPGEAGFRIVVGIRATDDVEGSESYSTVEIKTPAAIAAAIELRDAVLARAAAAGKPLNQVEI